MTVNLLAKKLRSGSVQLLPVDCQFAGSARELAHEKCYACARNIQPVGFAVCDHSPVRSVALSFAARHIVHPRRGICQSRPILPRSLPADSRWRECPNCRYHRMAPAPSSAEAILAAGAMGNATAISYFRQLPIVPDRRPEKTAPLQHAGAAYLRRALGPRREANVGFIRDASVPIAAADRGSLHFGGCSPGDESHPLIWDTVSNCRIFLRSASI